MSGVTMHYSRAVKSGPWHQAREAEPKDYEISVGDVRDLRKSTYETLGGGDHQWPRTTYQDLTDSSTKKSCLKEQDLSMVTEDTIDAVNLDRNLPVPKRGSNAIFPRHPVGYDQHHMITTHKSDFGAPLPYMELNNATTAEVMEPDHTDAHKRCLSQFADTTNHRRPGRNTWQDESGVYANSHLRRQMHEAHNPLFG